MTPEHLHLILNHAPIFGLFAALIPLVVGAWRASRELVLVGLIMGALFGASTLVVSLSGEAAEERMEARLDPAGKSWLDAHEERAEVIAPLVYFVAAACAAGAVLLLKKPTWLRPLSLTCAALVLVCVGGLGWVAQAGGQIRHPELRASGQTAPAPPLLDED